MPQDMLHSYDEETPVLYPGTLAGPVGVRSILEAVSTHLTVKSKLPTHKADNMKCIHPN